ncbi:hypothetical protein MUK42_19155 [Musa troglodytarum]|uniref:Uncharacterized protein n=1 Tax=Musa troglodytarum TaxID=320322 RepID=A0A9E7K1X4_9LILI|nr:hypothetical protein MUK42_19155 [Musa troglodytarum]
MISNGELTCVLIALSAVSCAFFSITHSLVGADNKLYYGVATLRGLYVFNCRRANAEERRRVLGDLEEYRLRPLDCVHAVFAVLVFLTLAFGDAMVQHCLFPDSGPNTIELLSFTLSDDNNRSVFCSFFGGIARRVILTCVVANVAAPQQSSLVTLGFNFPLCSRGIHRSACPTTIIATHRCPLPKLHSFLNDGFFPFCPSRRRAARAHKKSYIPCHLRLATDHLFLASGSRGCVATASP